MAKGKEEEHPLGYTGESEETKTKEEKSKLEGMSHLLKPDRLGTSLEDKEIPYIDMLIYGRSGAGKTYRTSTAPPPIYLLTPDPTGHKSYPFIVDGRLVRSMKDIRNVIDGIKAGGHGYQTLVVDGLSWIYDILVKEMGDYFHKERGAADPDLMPIQARLKIQNAYTTMLRELVDLTQVSNEKDRVNVIFTTLDERLKEDDLAPFQVRPLIGSAKMNEKIPAFFSVISYITPVGEVDEKGQPTGDRAMYFAEVGGVMARDRMGLFPSLMKPAPDLSKYLPSRK